MRALAERNQVMELIKNLPDEQISYVLHIIQSLPLKTQSAPRCNLRGRFSNYANPNLRSQEKDAWSLAAEEKPSVR